MKKSIAIIGVGNFLMGDEGVGIHAINHLREYDWPEDVELIDAGTPGASLIHLLEDRELSIVIDCGDFKGEPGEILVTDVKRLKKPDEQVLSMHETSLLGTFSLAEKLGIKIGKVILICIQPKNVEMTQELSDECKGSLNKLRDKIEPIYRKLF